MASGVMGNMHADMPLRQEHFLAADFVASVQQLVAKPFTKRSATACSTRFEHGMLET